SKRCLHDAMDELTKPQLDRPGRRQRTAILVSVLQATPEKRNQISGQTVLRYDFAFTSPVKYRRRLLQIKSSGMLFASAGGLPVTGVRHDHDSSDRHHVPTCLIVVLYRKQGSSPTNRSNDSGR